MEGVTRGDLIGEARPSPSILTGDDQHLPHPDQVGVPQTVGFDQGADRDPVTSSDVGKGVARYDYVISAGGNDNQNHEGGFGESEITTSSVGILTGVHNANSCPGPLSARTDPRP